MNEPIESLYQQIGQAMADSISEEWLSARLVIEKKTGVTSIRGEYNLPDGALERSLRPSRKIMELSNQLHERMVEEMQANWKSAHVELRYTGEISVEFEY